MNLILIELKETLTLVCQSLEIINDDYVFDQCIVNNYFPGQGISKHIDLIDFGSVIGCFSICSGSEMVFQRGEEKYGIYAEPNSLYIMSGDSRYKYTHEMVSKKSDNGKTRDRRISITFRNVKKSLKTN